MRVMNGEHEAVVKPCEMKCGTVLFMREQQLAAALQRPEVHREVLGNYRGGYSLGVTRANGRAALLLRVEDGIPDHVPSEIFVDGEPVPVIVHGDFRAPRAF